MTDSETPDMPAETREERIEQRCEQVKRWAAYVDSTPADVWGDQLNTLVEAQLDAARSADISTEEYARIERASRK